MRKTYTLKLHIYEGSDEFWESYPEPKQVLSEILRALEDNGFTASGIVEEWTTGAPRPLDKRIFSGPDSEIMWSNINNAATVTELRLALYHVCCKLQELESLTRK